MEKCNEVKAVAYHAFSMSRVGIFYLGRTVTALLFTVSIVKSFGDVATLT
jgi:hypothetical protein